MGNEKSVVRVLCGEKEVDSNGNINFESCVTGTGFFIDNDLIITANHVITNYYEIEDKVYVNPINLGDGEFYEAEVISSRNESPIAVLKLDRKFEVDCLKFVDNYEIKTDDNWKSSGHPQLLWNKGHVIKGEVLKELNECQSPNSDYHLSLENNTITDLSGMSGSPFFINGMLLGVLIEQSEANKNAISVGVVSINRIIDKIDPKYTSSIINNNSNLNDVYKFNIPFSENLNFVGRKDTLKEIHNSLNDIKIEVLTGMSGIGKTQLALKYIYNNINKYNYIFWINSEDETSIVNSYTDIALELGIITGDEKSERRVIKRFVDWLSKTDKWVMVFDNCEEYDQIFRFMPKIHNGNIIITSKNPNWKELKSPICLEVFTKEEASDFLVKRANVHDEYVEDLANKLGYLPLALNQAAAYIDQSKISFSKYIELYDKYPRKLFEKNYSKNQYEYTINTVWKISLEKIEEISSVSVKLMKFISLFFNHNIPKNIIYENLHELEHVLSEEINEIEFNDSIAILRKYALIDSTQDYISTHCLIQSAIHNELIEQNEFSSYGNKFIDYLYNLMPADLENSEKIKGIRRLVPHIDYITKFISEVDENYIDFLYRFGLILRLNAQYEYSKVVLEKSLSLAVEFYANGSNTTLRIKTLLAGVFSDLGEFKKALTLYDNILDENKDSDIRLELNDIACINNKALIKFNIEAYNEAEHCYEDALKIYKSKEDKIIKELNESNISGSLSDIINGQKSTVMVNLSSVKLKLDKVDEANSNIDEAMNIIYRIYGRESIQYSRALNNKANILDYQNEYSKAKELYEEAIEIDKLFYDENHNEVFSKKCNLLSCKYNLQPNKDDFVEKELINMLDISKETFGEDSLNYAGRLKSLAQMYRKQEKYELSIKILQEVKKIYLEYFGKLNESLIEINKLIIKCLLRMKPYNFQKSILDIINETLRIDEFINNNLDRIELLIEIGIDFANEELYDEAIKFIKNALKLSVQIYGQDSEYVRTCYICYGKIYSESEKYEKALYYEEKLLKLHLQKFDANSGEVARSYSNTAYLYHILGNSDKAIEYSKKAIEIININIEINYEDKQGIEEHYDIINRYNNDSILSILNKYTFDTIEDRNTLVIVPRKIEL